MDKKQGLEERAYEAAGVVGGHGIVRVGDGELRGSSQCACGQLGIPRRQEERWEVELLG